MKTSVVAATELLWNSEKLCGWCDRDWCPFHSQKLLIEIIIWWCYTASNWSWDSHHFTFQCYRHLQAHSGNGWFSAIPSPIGGFWHCWKTTLSHEPSIVSRLYIYIVCVHTHVPLYLHTYIHIYTTDAKGKTGQILRSSKPQFSALVMIDNGCNRTRFFETGNHGFSHKIHWFDPSLTVTCTTSFFFPFHKPNYYEAHHDSRKGGQTHHPKKKWKEKPWAQTNKQGWPCCQARHCGGGHGHGRAVAYLGMWITEFLLSESFNMSNIKYRFYKYINLYVHVCVYIYI